MNRAQRLILKIILGLDVLLLVFPPFEINRGFRYWDLGYHWLPFWWFGPGQINFGRLASEIGIVSIVGFTVYVLARDVTDNRLTKALSRLQVSGSVPQWEIGSRIRQLQRVSGQIALWVGRMAGIATAAFGIYLALAQTGSTMIAGVLMALFGGLICALAFHRREAP
jgi:hypothetical protein